MEKLTIITINYNDAKGLQQTIESIIHQSHKVFEYVVIDGGSTDSSLDVIKKYQDYISYWVSEPDRGIYNAMNKGLAKANGEYVLFINSGDNLASTNVIHNAMTHLNEEDIIAFNINYVKDGVMVLRRPPEDIKFSYFCQYSLPHPSTFIKRTLFDKVGFFDETLKIASDWKFYILAFFKHHVTYKNVDELITNFNLDGISSTQSANEELQMVLSKYFSRYLSDYKELQEYKQFSHTYTFKAAKKLHRYWLFRKGFKIINSLLK